MTTRVTTEHKRRRYKRRDKPDRPVKPPINQAAIDLLRSWRNVSEEDAQEQRETMDYLKKALDERRPPGYKLFE